MCTDVELKWKQNISFSPSSSPLQLRRVMRQNCRDLIWLNLSKSTQWLEIEKFILSLLSCPEPLSLKYLGFYPLTNVSSCTTIILLYSLSIYLCCLLSIYLCCLLSIYLCCLLSIYLCCLLSIYLSILWLHVSYVVYSLSIYLSCSYFMFSILFCLENQKYFFGF